MESILLLVRFDDDDTESSFMPGLIATIHLARVEMNTSETPPGNGGSTHTSFHAFGASKIKNSATDFGMILDELWGHQISARFSRALLWITLNRPS
jgi:hypothetical protein